MIDDEPGGTVPPADRALVSKVHVIDGTALQFAETGSGQARDDTFDLEWESTPAPAQRAELRPPPTTPPRAAPVAPLATPIVPAPPVPPAASPPQAAPAPVGRPPDVPPQRRERPRLGSEDSLETKPAILARLRPADLQAAIHHFDVLDLEQGETLIGEGERHPALVMVLRGQIEASRGRLDRRRVGSGETLGLTTLFGTGVWATTLRTLSEARVMVLELDGYRALRSAGSLVALTIEEYALETFLEAQKRTAQRLADLVKSQPLEEIVPPRGAVARMAAALGLGGVSHARLDAMPALLASPPFRNAEAQHLAVLAQRVEALNVPAGEVLIRQGEESSHLYLLVTGSVDVLTEARGKDRVVRQETLRPGDLFGGWSMLRSSPEWCSHVVAERSTVLALGKMDWTELATAGDSTGSVLRLALLRSLGRRLHQATGRVASLESGAPPPTSPPAEEDAQFVTINPASRR